MTIEFVKVYEPGAVGFAGIQNIGGSRVVAVGLLDAQVHRSDDDGALGSWSALGAIPPPGLPSSATITPPTDQATQVLQGTVVAPGSAGNAYTLAATLGVGLNVPMSAVEVGTAITVTLGTDGAGAWDATKNTIALIAAAINGAAADVVFTASGDGSNTFAGGFPFAYGPTNFINGYDLADLSYYFVWSLFSPTTDLLLADIETFDAGDTMMTAGIMRSTDGGDNWSNVKPMLHADPEFDAEQGATAWAALSSTHYLGCGFITDPASGSSLTDFLETTDSGATWTYKTQVGAPDSLGSNQVVYEALCRLDNGALLLGTDLNAFGSIVFKSTDNAANWTAKTLTGADPTSDSVVRFTDMTGGVVFCITTAGVWRSSDYGDTWAQVWSGPGSGKDGVKVAASVGLISVLNGAGGGWQLSEDNALTFGTTGVLPVADVATHDQVAKQMILADDGSVLSASSYTGVIWGAPAAVVVVVPTVTAFPDTLAARPSQPTATKFTAVYSSGGGALRASPSIVGGFHL